MFQKGFHGFQQVFDRVLIVALDFNTESHSPKALHQSLVGPGELPSQKARLISVCAKQALRGPVERLPPPNQAAPFWEASAPPTGGV